jgi:hypothetical protein
MRAGLAWLDDRSGELFTAGFLAATEAQQVQILQPLSDELDRRQRAALTARYRSGGAGGSFYAPRTDATEVEPRPAPAAAGSPVDVPVRFFRLVKNLTADGYYTSRVGLLQELGYKGNSAMLAFPGCTVPEQ